MLYRLKLWYLGPHHPLCLPRAGGWGRLRDAHLDLYPRCAVCGKVKRCVPHHKKPVHAFPKLELDPGNLITLCPEHHLLFGHLMNWSSWNPDVTLDCAEWRSKIASRPLKE